MRLNDILSDELPAIDDSVKECVNLGQWLLFKSDEKANKEDKVAFYLKAGASVFGLNERGEVLREFDRDEENLQVDELYYFSDLPKPHSISNTAVSLESVLDIK